MSSRCWQEPPTRVNSNLRWAPVLFLFFWVCFSELDTRPLFLFVSPPHQNNMTAHRNKGTIWRARKGGQMHDVHQTGNCFGLLVKYIALLLGEPACQICRSPPLSPPTVLLGTDCVTPHLQQQMRTRTQHASQVILEKRALNEQCSMASTKCIKAVAQRMRLCSCPCFENLEQGRTCYPDFVPL